MKGEVVSLHPDHKDELSVSIHLETLPIPKLPFPKINTSTNPLVRVSSGISSGFGFVLCKITFPIYQINPTNKIIDFLKSRASKKPWFYYIHIQTLHPIKEYFASYDSERVPLNQGIKDFDNEKFGAGLYERTVSFIDHELGKILEHVDLDNTILILTSDHGQTIPHEGKHEVDFEPRLETSKKIGLKFLPKTTHKAGGQFLYKIRKLVSKRKLNKANQKLTNYQKRSREAFDKVSLFDEMLHVPLLFAGNHINSSTVSDLVHNTDIFPTLCELVNINLNQSIHGRNLVPLIEGNKIEEKPMYLYIFLSGWFASKEAIAKVSSASNISIYIT